MSNFQIVITGLFVLFIVVGVGLFAAFGGAFGGGGIGSVTVWGTMDQETAGRFFDTVRATSPELQDVKYVERDPRTYREDLVNAMASGSGPDLFMVPQEEINFFADKVLPISYKTISQSAFFSSYVDAAQLFLVSQGTLAVPLYVDPIVMYWNRDLYAGAGISQPPSVWNDFLSVAPKISSLNTGAGFKRSAVALGEWQNIDHAKEILSTLFLQAGDSLVVRAQDDKLSLVFGYGSQGNAPAESALRFYTEFANPSKTTYSWNRSLPRSLNAFASGELATYFGFATDYARITERNPNLRFSVAVVPQLNPRAALTYGSVMGLAVPRTAYNPSGAAITALRLTSAEASAALVQLTGVTSARRDTPIDTSTNATLGVFAQSALISRGWQDPNPEATDEIFKAMIESVVSGRAQPVGAVGQASLEFSQLLPQ